MNMLRSNAVMGLVVTTLCFLSGSASAGDGFADDVAFMKKHTQIVLLQDGDAAVAVAPAYQGRVMTSTFDRKAGPSFGWINRPVIEKGLLSDEEKKGKLEEHIYIFGGEERFWLGPEGGQYALFFKPGSKFEFSDWTTPPVIDTEAFELAEQTATSAKFTHATKLINYSGTEFKVGIERTVKLLGKEDASKLLGVELTDGLRMVAYETDNRITNTGSGAWKPDSGLLSIWILGMYNPSPETTVVIPFKAGDEKSLGPKVNDTYFGKVPPEYLKVRESKVVLPRRRHAPRKDRYHSTALEGDCRKLRCRRTGAQHRHLQRAGRTTRIRQFDVGTTGETVRRRCDQFLQRRFARTR